MKTRILEYLNGHCEAPVLGVCTFPQFEQMFFASDVELAQKWWESHEPEDIPRMLAEVEVLSDTHELLQAAGRKFLSGAGDA